MGRIPDHLVSLAFRALENRWVTIGAKADSKRPGKKKGGTPVELDGEGKITKGPAALTGKRPSELSQSHLFTGQDHKSQRKLFAEPGDPPPPPPIDETPKAPAPAAKKEPKPRAKKPLSMSLLAVIRREGGISSGDFEHADFKEFGLLGALNKKGLSLDDMAATMVRQGHITVPMGKSSPSDHLLQLLKKKTNSLLAADTAEYDKDYEAYMQAREEAQSDGYPEEQLAEASGRGEEAGDQESKDRLFDEIFGGDGGGGEEAGRDDEPGDLAGDSAEPTGGVDTSFDFGPAAAPKVDEKPKAAKPKKAAADKPKGATLQPDGTLKTKDGTVWTRAKAGGEHSPVTDKHYKGGQWMPIHGMSKPKAEKPAEEPVGTQAVEPGENDKEQAEDKGPRMREPRQPATPEEIAQKQKDQEHWDAVKQGPLGRIRGWMGDFPNKIGAQASINSKEWQKLADEMGPEKVKQIADEMERRRLDRLSEIYDEGKAKGHIKNETKKDFLNAYKKIWDKDNWGLGQRHVAKNPHSARAAMHLYNEMGEPQTPQSLRELNDYLAGVQNVQDEPAAPAPPAIEPQAPTPPPPPATNLFGQPEPTKPQPATTQGLFGEQVPVEDPKVKPRETIADQAEKGLDWLDQKQDPRTDGTGEMFGGLFSPGRTSGATEPEAGPVAPPAVEPSPSVTKPKATSLPDRIKNLKVLLNKTRSSANAKALRTAIDQLEREAQGPVEAPAVSEPEPANPATKPTHEMTKAEFQKAYMDKANELLTKVKGRKIKDVMGVAGKAIAELGGDHFEQIKKARAAGKAIPQEVLADYPYLKEPHEMSQQEWAAKWLASSPGRAPRDIDMDLVKLLRKADVKRAIDAGKQVPASVLADYPDLKPGTEEYDPLSRREDPGKSDFWLQRKTELDKNKPSPINRMFGPNPTPEQQAIHAERVKDHNRKYRQAEKMRKELREIEDAAYRKKPTTESRTLSNIRQQLREAFRQCP